ncbi:MAG TPA: hypothetical protein VGI58_16845 [Streptosporangiaceae bacterium]|jgi:hypothetical protein
MPTHLSFDDHLAGLARSGAALRDGRPDVLDQWRTQIRVSCS